MLHDTTTYFAKQINTIFIQVVSGNGDVYKVPFSMKEVGGSFTGEVLCSELLEEMSKIKKVPHNATTKLKDAIAAYKDFVAGTPQQQYKRIHLKLMEAAERADIP